MSMDRRKPVARYVLLADQGVQERLADAAERAYRRFVQADSWAAGEVLSMPAAGEAPAQVAAVPPKRRGLRRRPTEAPPPVRTITVTAAVASAARTALDVPGQVAALGGCPAEARLATSMSEVVLELVEDLAAEPVAAQHAHPAYRQTVRLAAELRALEETLRDEGCGDAAGCVAVRSPGAWGRREEDVEVSEVLAVLRQLAQH